MKFSDLKAAHKPREKRVTLVLDGALLAEHEALSEQLADAMGRRTSLGDPGTTEIAERVPRATASSTPKTTRAAITAASMTLRACPPCSIR
jgi:hypothetical protein